MATAIVSGHSLYSRIQNADSRVQMHYASAGCVHMYFYT
jgi:hypothetical protein